MRQDYAAMKTWHTHPEFTEIGTYLAKVPASDQPLQEDKIDAFFKFGLAENEKMFRRWIKVECLAFLAVFAEVQTARLVSQRILGLPLCSDAAKTQYDEERNLWVDPRSNGEWYFVKLTSI